MINDLHAMIPSSRTAKVVKSLVLKEKNATMAPDLRSHELRPTAKTPIANFFLAGDWIQTGSAGDDRERGDLRAGRGRRGSRADRRIAIGYIEMTTKLALVTGGNGFVGCHVVRALLARGDRVRVLARENADLSALAGLPVEDRVRRSSILRFRRAGGDGCSEVYHVAADYRLWLTDPAPMYATNVERHARTLSAPRPTPAFRESFTPARSARSEFRMAE